VKVLAWGAGSPWLVGGQLMVVYSMIQYKKFVAIGIMSLPTKLED